MTKGKLTIKVLHGKIYDKDSMGPCQLYVKVTMGDQSDQSMAETKGKNETVFDFTTSFNRHHEDKVCLEVWMKKGDEDTMIGKGVINIPEITKMNKWTDWVEVKNHGKVTGEVYCDADFLPDRDDAPSSPGKQNKHHHTQTIPNH
jgi:C2 domain.